jgi:hypothetical protein
MVIEVLHETQHSVVSNVSGLFDDPEIPDPSEQRMDSTHSILRGMIARLNLSVSMEGR